jgi:hypothetical protein
VKGDAGSGHLFCFAIPERLFVVLPSTRLAIRLTSDAFPNP